MDRLIYTAMTGASHILERQATISNNLANNNTTGYRSAIDSFRAIPLVGEGLPTRTFVVNGLSGYDLTPATLTHTGRSLDVGINGKGWIAVLLPDNTEAYTRNGNLQVSTDGILQTNTGYPVIDDNGELVARDQIDIPPRHSGDHRTGRDHLHSSRRHSTHAQYDRGQVEAGRSLRRPVISRRRRAVPHP